MTQRTRLHAKGPSAGRTWCGRPTSVSDMAQNGAIDWNAPNTCGGCRKFHHNAEARDARIARELIREQASKQQAEDRRLAGE